MKRFGMMLLFTTAILTFTGCASIRVTTYDFPSVGGTDVLVTNSSPRKLEMWLNANPYIWVSPWGTAKVEVHRTYFNHGTRGEFMVSVRVKVTNCVVTLSRKFYFSNQHFRVEKWNLTERYIMNAYSQQCTQR